MKGKLEYDLSNFEERRDWKLVNDGGAMSIALWDMYILFRQELKYNEKITTDQYEIVEKLQGRFHEMLREANLEYILDGN